MKQIDTIPIIDIATQQQGYSFVRADPQQVALCLSLEDDGDLEVILSMETAERLVKALQEAIRLARGQ